MAEAERVPFSNEAPPEVPPESMGEAGPEVEARARKMGWVPREEWRGPPQQWKTAQEFVDFVDSTESPAVLRENLRRMEQRVDTITRQNDELKSLTQDQTKVILQLKKWAENADEAGYQRAKRELLEKARVAATTSDIPAYDQAQRELEALEEGRRASAAAEEPPARREAQPPAQPQQDAPQRNPEVDAWVQQQSAWFHTYTDMRQDAIALYGRLLQDRPDMTTQQHLAEVLRKIKAMYPDKFRNARRDAPAAVSSPTGPSIPQEGPQGGRMTYNDLPADAKAACDRFVRTIPGYKREQYVEEWVRQEAIAKERAGVQ